MDLNLAIEFAQLVNFAYGIAPDDLTNAAGKTIYAGGRVYTVVTTIYANDLKTDIRPDRGGDWVSIGLICQAVGTGEVAVAIRGTEGIYEWMYDAEFFQVKCPFLAGAGETDDGFTRMYSTLRIGAAATYPTVLAALPTLRFPQSVTSMTICGHSLGGSLATLLALDLAVNTTMPKPAVFTYASPRTGNSLFASTFDDVIKDSFRVVNRMDLVPHLPFPPAYDHVLAPYELVPLQLLPFPPKLLVKLSVVCEHSIDSYIHLLSLSSGGAVIPLDPACAP